MTTSLSRASDLPVAEGAGGFPLRAPEHRPEGCFPNTAVLVSRAFDLSLGRSALSEAEHECDLRERIRP